MSYVFDTINPLKFLGTRCNACDTFDERKPPEVLNVSPVVIEILKADIHLCPSCAAELESGVDG